MSEKCFFGGLRCWSWNSNTLATWCEELAHLKRPWHWERLKAGGEGETEDKMVGWHHWLNGHEFGWTLGVGDGQGGLACCSSRGHTEFNTTEWLNWTELIWLERGVWGLPGCPPRELFQNLFPWTGMWAQWSETSILDSRSKHLLGCAPDTFSAFLVPTVLWKLSPLVIPTLLAVPSANLNW